MLSLACLATMILLYIRHTTSGLTTVDSQEPAVTQDKFDGLSNTASDPEVDRQIEDIQQKLKEQELSATGAEDKETKEISNDKSDTDLQSDSSLSTGMDSDAFNPEVEYKSILSMSPVVIFSKSYCPYSTRLKSLFAESYGFEPIYTVVELDKHSHGSELQNYITEQTGRRTVPNVVVDGASRGGCDDFISMHQNDILAESFDEWTDSVKVTRL